MIFSKCTLLGSSEAAQMGIQTAFSCSSVISCQISPHRSEWCRPGRRASLPLFSGAILVHA